MNTSSILLEQNNDIAHLILDRPPKNETDSHLFEELSRLANQVLPKLRVSGIICYGRGRHFSSGANVAELKKRVQGPPDKSSTEYLLHNISAIHALADLPYPVVAAIGGCCLGSGLELALACNYRIATKNAVMALPETQIGLMPGCGGTVRMSKLVGYSKAIELILTGKSLLADEALKIGLVDMVVSRKELLSAAEKLVRKIRLYTNGIEIGSN
ncbi:MAG: enoyl-CoA hydratase/isomerase family protein [Pseudomonadota bacterium]